MVASEGDAGVDGQLTVNTDTRYARGATKAYVV